MKALKQRGLIERLEPGAEPRRPAAAEDFLPGDSQRPARLRGLPDDLLAAQRRRSGRVRTAGGGAPNSDGARRDRALRRPARKPAVCELRRQRAPERLDHPPHSSLGWKFA